MEEERQKLVLSFHPINLSRAEDLATAIDSTRYNTRAYLSNVRDTLHSGHSLILGAIKQDQNSSLKDCNFLKIFGSKSYFRFC